MVRNEYGDSDMDSSEKICHSAVFLVAFALSLIMTALTFLASVVEKNDFSLIPFFSIYFVGWVLFGYWREIVRINGMRQ
jgi:hypothetical protein